MTGSYPPARGTALTSLPEAALIGAVRAIQSLVASGAPPTVIYEAVLEHALSLLDCDGGSLRFVDLEDPSWSEAVAWRGSIGKGERWRHRAPITEGLSGQVIATGRPAKLEGVAASATGSRLAPRGTEAMIGVPIHEHGVVTGSLVVCSIRRGRRWTDRELELLTAFSDHIAVAVNVAKANQAIHQSLSDPLTGLANRRMLIDRLRFELARADRGGHLVTVLFLDLDGFKLVNDSLGHFVGDQLLIAVGERLRGSTGNTDVCARLGGDEFAVLMVGKQDPVQMAKRIIEAIERPFVLADEAIFVSVSVGIATGRDEAETLLRQADVAMYQAKQTGQGRYVTFEPSMQLVRQSRLALKTELRRAIARDEFELHYQPLIDLRSGAIVAFEGLVRWRHDTRGLISPLDFIPLAEETGLILDIGRRVLELGCAQLAAWREVSLVTLGLNIAASELLQPDYPAAVQAAIAGAFPPAALVLEITERAPLEDPRFRDALRTVKALGVRLALDDFGTGYSTLLNLTELPIDLLKIPKPFIDQIGPDAIEPPGLLAGIVGLAQRLGLTTVAEGIEVESQRAMVTSLQCDLGQGFLFARPLTAAAATDLLKQQTATRRTGSPRPRRARAHPTHRSTPGSRSDLLKVSSGTGQPVVKRSAMEHPRG